MTRFAAAICLAMGFCGLVPVAGHAQSEETGDRCFPWQEFRNGVCVARPNNQTAQPSPQPAPAPPAVTPVPCLGGNGASGQCVCPADTHLDAAAGRCVAEAAPPAPLRNLTAVACDGGTVSDGTCTCPTGFNLMPAAGGSARGGTCVRTDAQNCLGGELTVAGQCLCNGQVTMSGQVYDLEFSRGKCVPKRCPRDGTCAATTARPGNDQHETGGRPKLSSDEPERHHGCGRGMVETRSGCVPARQRYHAIDPGSYLRMYRPPNYASPLQN